MPIHNVLETMTSVHRRSRRLRGLEPDFDLYEHMVSSSRGRYVLLRSTVLQGLIPNFDWFTFLTDSEYDALYKHSDIHAAAA